MTAERLQLSTTATTATRRRQQLIPAVWLCLCAVSAALIGGSLLLVQIQKSFAQQRDTAAFRQQQEPALIVGEQQRHGRPREREKALDNYHQKLLQEISIKTEPIRSFAARRGEDEDDDPSAPVIVPPFFMAVLDGMRRCALPADGAFCALYRNGTADPHVLQTVMTVLPERCGSGGGNSRYDDRNDGGGTSAPPPPPPPRRPLVFDFGANVGQYTLMMRALGCQVVAVEPQPAMNWFHRASLVANGWESDGSVTLHEKAVSDVPGEMELTKLWQPGNKNAGRMTVGTVTLNDLFFGEASSKNRQVELLKLDIDGPEIYTLRGLARLMTPTAAKTNQVVVKNIVAELSVSAWNRRMSFDDKTVQDIFQTFYNVGYRIFLQYEKEFPKYPGETMSKLRRVTNLGEIALSYEVPRERIIEVLFMNGRSTKNLYMTIDDEILDMLERRKSSVEV